LPTDKQNETKHNFLGGANNLLGSDKGLAFNPRIFSPTIQSLMLLELLYLLRAIIAQMMQQLPTAR